MRILVIYYKPFFPVNSGDKNVIAAHIAELSRFAEVDLLSFGSPPEKKGTLPRLRRHIYIQHSKIEKLTAFVKYFSLRKPLQCALYSVPSVLNWLKKHADDYDVLYPHFFRSFTLVENIDSRIIVHLHDALSLNYLCAQKTEISFWRRWVYRYEIPRLKKYELTCIEKAEHTFTVSPVDRDYFITNGAPKEKIDHIPITVSEHLFHIKKPVKPKQLCFFGNMSYIANIDAVEWFVKEVFPSLPEDVTFIIIGASPPKRILQLASDRIRVTGYVDNPYDLIAESAIMIAPLRIASGVQVKILEGMALGKPIIATSICTDSLHGQHRTHFIQADMSKAFIDEIITLLYSPNDSQKLGENARVFCIQNHCSLVLRRYFSS